MNENLRCKNRILQDVGDEGGSFGVKVVCMQVPVPIQGGMSSTVGDYTEP